MSAFKVCDCDCVWMSVGKNWRAGGCFSSLRGLGTGARRKLWGVVTPAEGRTLVDVGGRTALAAGRLSRRTEVLRGIAKCYIHTYMNMAAFGTCRYGWSGHLSRLLCGCGCKLRKVWLAEGKLAAGNFLQQAVVAAGRVYSRYFNLQQGNGLHFPR